MHQPPPESKHILKSKVAEVMMGLKFPFKKMWIESLKILFLKSKNTFVLPLVIEQ